MIVEACTRHREEEKDMLELQTDTPLMVGDWETAKKEIRQLGIRVTTSLKSCALGCVGCSDDITAEETALFQSAKRWDSYYGGYLNHQNIEPFEAFKIAEILIRNRIDYKWDKPFHAIEINLGR